MEVTGKKDAVPIKKTFKNIPKKSNFMKKKEAQTSKSFRSTIESRKTLKTNETRPTVTKEINGLAQVKQSQ